MLFISYYQKLQRKLNTYSQTGVKAIIKVITIILKYYYYLLKSKIFGPGRSCNICEWYGHEFEPYLVLPFATVTNSRCPECKSLVRHRAYRYFYEIFFAARPNIRADVLLHFSPESCLTAFLSKNTNQYLMSVFNVHSPGDVLLDLRNLGLKDESVALIIMNHVALCVHPITNMVQELYRVLEKNGIVLMGDDVRLNQKTIELESKGWGESWRTYGEFDLKEQFFPFSVMLKDATSTISSSDRIKLNISNPEYVIILEKNNEII